MPIKKSAMKALRQANKRAVRNKKVKETVSFLRRTVRKSIEAKDAKATTTSVKDAIKALDKAAQNKVMKKNTVARLKSRMMKKANAVTKK
jgi:small subunit ribosomal protein S20